MVQVIFDDNFVRDKMLALFDLVRLWLFQFFALVWKELLAAFRRPVYTIAQMISPAIIVALLSYGAAHAPKIPVPGFSYPERITLNTTSLTTTGSGRGLPSMGGAFTGGWSDLKDTLSDAHAVLHEAIAENYFADQLLPAYVGATKDVRKYDPSIAAVNVPAATPFLIPSLSTYLAQREAMRRHVGRLGVKQYGATNDFIWHLFNKGKIAFYPQSVNVDMIANFLIDTAGDPAAVKAAISPFSPTAFSTRINYGYPTLSGALAAAGGAWAVVHVKSLHISPSGTNDMTFDFTIMMNQTVVPTTDEVIGRFPKGLGKKYAEYLYSGFSVLQRAVNNYAARAGRKAAVAAGVAPQLAQDALLSATEIGLSLCEDKSMYLQPHAGSSQAEAAKLLVANGGPHVRAAVAPSMEPAVNAPCAFEALLACRAEFDNAEKDEPALLRCLRAVDAVTADTPRSSVCSDALNFLVQNSDGTTFVPSNSVPETNASNPFQIGDCFADTYLCGDANTNSTGRMTMFLTGLQISNTSNASASSNQRVHKPNTQCLSFDHTEFASACGRLSPFAQLTQAVASTTENAFDLCAHDVQRLCPSYADGPKNCWGGAGPGCGYGPLQCLKYETTTGKKAFERPACAALVAAAPSDCLDDLRSLCPWEQTASLAKFPSLCLHMNRDYLSASCFNSALREDHLDRLFAMSVTVTSEDRATAACRVAHDLEAAFGESAVAAVAMFARPYTQRPFFENLGPLAGLIVAIAFSVPFCAIVRRIVEDRFHYRRAYLLLIGAGPSAIIASDGFVGFVYLLFSAFTALLALTNLLPDSSAGMMFGVLFTYAMALTSFATFVASLFNNPKTANSVAPMLLFLTALPSYVTLMDMDMFSKLLPPAVAASCFNDIVAFSISTATKDYGYDIAIYSASLFGLSIFFAVLTFIVEYIRYMRFGFGFFYNIVHEARRLCSSATRVVVRPVEGSAMYEAVSGRDYTGRNTWRRAVREADLEDGEGDEEVGVPSAALISNGNGGNGSSSIAMTSFGRGGGGGDPNEIEFGEFNNAAGAVPLTEDYSIAETPINNRTDYSIGGVPNGATYPLSAAGQAGATAAQQTNSAPNVADPSPASVAPHDIHQHRGGPIASARFVDLTNVSYKVNRLHHGAVRATTDVTASLYRNRVNVVIGPGGSGKSSLMQVLTGQETPSSGECLIDGREARFYDHIGVGVCLQRDVTWDTLSVTEHLELLQMIKGSVYETAAAAERLALCEALQLDAHATLYADALPDGVRRRLSVAMAFAGGSKYIVLDEPTTAVDPVGRRCMWRLFNENAIGRCLVVATTNVEEAEAAEHVLLVHRGAVKASGSPQFLKKHLGGGSTIVSVSRGQHCNAASIIARVRAVCPRTRLINNVGQELSFRVDSADFHSVPDLVAELEAAADENDVVSVSVADSRLDELFMVCVREYDAATGTEMPGTDGRFEGDDLSEGLTSGSSGAAAAGDEAVGNTAGGGYAADDAYVSHESAPTIVTRGNSSNANNNPNAPQRGRRSNRRAAGASSSASSSAPAGTSTHHVDARAVVPVDPSWFRTLGIVGSDRERKARADGWSLISRNTATVIFMRVSGMLTDMIGPAIEFLVPLFAVIMAVGIMTIDVADPPSLLLTPGLYRYSRVYFTTPDASEGAALNERLFRWDLSEVDPSLAALSRFTANGDYRFVHLENGDGMALSNGYAVSYDNHERAEFMGGFAFDDTFANTVILDRATRSVLRKGTSWPASLIFHNTSTPHALPSFVNVFDSLRIKKLTNIKTVRLLGRSDPFAGGETARMAGSRAVLAIVGTLLVLVPFSFLPGAFVYQVVAERQSGILAALTASKLSPVSYWIGSFVWHMIRYLFFAVCAIFAVAYGGARPLLGTQSSTIDALGLFFLYGCCSIALGYLIGRCFKDALSAQTFVTLVNFVFGVVCVVAINAMDIMGPHASADGTAAVDAAKGSGATTERREFFRIVPAYALGEGLLKIASGDFFASAENTDDFAAHKSISSMLAVLGWTFPFYLLFLIAFDGFFRVWCIRAVFGAYSLVRDGMLVVFAPCMQRSNVVGNNSGDPLRREPWSGDLRIHREGEDPSVTAEREKGPCADGVTVREVWRKFTGFGAEHNTYAVRGASFTIAPGDRLAVIGGNGSGKSTLTRIVGGVLAPSVGTVEIKMRPLEKSSRLHWWARTFTGYAASTVGAVPGESTPYMALNFMADYRGMARDEVREGHIAHLLHALGILTAYNTPIAVLSESKRRRVGVAMALVGFPPVILLDEPTAGMDPVGRRMTWAALNLIPSRCALVLTTHRAEDVEMAANRVMVMQNGTVAFVNDAHVARQQRQQQAPMHAKGLILQIHLNLRTGAAASLAGGLASGGVSIGGSSASSPNSPAAAVDTFWVKNDIQDFVLRTFPGAVLLEDRNNTDLKFHLCADDSADTFRPSSGAGAIAPAFGPRSRRGPTDSNSASAGTSPTNAHSSGSPTDPNRVGRDLLDTGREREEEAAANGDIDVHEQLPWSAPSDPRLPHSIPLNTAAGGGGGNNLTIRHVFEKVHQKRVELMLQGIYGAPVSAPTSPSTDRNRRVQHSAMFGTAPTAADGQQQQRSSEEARHAQEVRDLLGGPDERFGPSASSAAIGAEAEASSTSDMAAGALTVSVDPTPVSSPPATAAAPSSPSSTNSSDPARVMPFDIVITRSAIDEVLDKVLGGGAETAALERLFQNTSARIPIRETTF